MAQKKDTAKKTSTSSARLTLSTLAPARGSRHRRKRLGIGEGSGSGKTSGRGQKGYGARSGMKQKRGFEGGQMPLHRRLPKYGFTSRKKYLGENLYRVVSVAKLEALNAKEAITLQHLLDSGLISSPRSRVKILGGSEVTKKLIVEAHAVSASAKEAIEKAGGEVRIVA